MSQGRKRNNRDSKKLLKSNVTGVVKRYIDTGGYGFITEDGTCNDVFFHISDVSKDNQRHDLPIRDGDRVTYDLYQAPKGYRAESVRILDEDLKDPGSEDNIHLYRRKDHGSGSTRKGEGNRGGAGNRRGQRRGGAGSEQNRRDGSAGRGYERNIDHGSESDDDGWGVPRGDRRGEQRWRGRGGGRDQYLRGESDRRGHERNIDDSHDDDSRERDSDGWPLSRGDRMQNWRTRNENVRRNVNDRRRLSPSSSTRRPRTDSPKRAGINKNHFGNTFPRSDASSDTWRKGSDSRSKPAPPPRRPTDSMKKEADINKESFTNGSSSQTGVSSEGSSQRTQNRPTTKESNIGANKSDTKSNPQPPTHRPTYSMKKEAGINKESFTNGSSSQTGVSSEGSSQGTQNTSKTKESNIGANKSDTKSNPQPPTHRPTYSMKKEAGINKESFTNGSSSQTGVSSEGSSQGTQNTSKTKESNIGANKSDTKSNPQPPPRTYSMKKEADINKESFTNRSSSQTGVSSEGSSQGTQNTTKSNESNIGANKSDTKSNPQPPPRTYSMKKEADINKESFTNGSSSQTSVSSEGCSKGTQNTTNSKESNIGANKSDTKSNPQPAPSSTVYSYSYAGGSNRFSVKKESSSLGTSKQAPGNRGNATTTSSSANDDISHSGGASSPDMPTKVPTTESGKTGNAPKVDTEASTASASASSLARERGNNKFRLAREQKNESFFKVARACYKEAYDCSQNDEEMVSAAKNMAMTHWRIATLRIETRTADVSDQNTIDKFFERALRCFRRAYTRKNCRGQAWASHLEKSIQECLDDIRSWIASKNEEDRIVALDEYLGYMPNCGAKVNGYLHIATIYFKRAKEALKLDEYENCKRWLKDCSVPLGEAEMCSDVDPSIGLGVAALRKDVKYHKGLVDKYVARANDLKARRKQQRAEEKAKQVAMEQLKADMENLDLLQELPIENCVDFVYRLWPPTTGPKLPLSSSSNSKKKILIRAISQYHPDKVDKRVHGIKWHLLSCEITKCLSMKLAKIK